MGHAPADHPDLLGSLLSIVSCPSSRAVHHCGSGGTASLWHSHQLNNFHSPGLWKPGSLRSCCPSSLHAETSWLLTNPALVTANYPVKWHEFAPWCSLEPGQNVGKRSKITGKERNLVPKLPRQNILLCFRMKDVSFFFKVDWWQQRQRATYLERFGCRLQLLLWWFLWESRRRELLPTAKGLALRLICRYGLMEKTHSCTSFLLSSMVTSSPRVKNVTEMKWRK